jgi:hypothetical protein
VVVVEELLQLLLPRIVSAVTWRIKSMRGSVVPGDHR